MPKGKINGYVCDTCERVTVTIDQDEGTTPMFLDCRADGHGRGCEGKATSLMYPEVMPAGTGDPEWEWYRPTEEWLQQRANVALRGHVKQGGLLLRPVTT